MQNTCIKDGQEEIKSTMWKTSIKILYTLLSVVAAVEKTVFHYSDLAYAQRVLIEHNSEPKNPANSGAGGRAPHEPS
jgi:hypothetical protein